MCQSRDCIRQSDIVIKDLESYEADYEIEKSSGGNGENEFRLLITRVMIENRIDAIQIKQDLQPLIKSPSLLHQFKTSFLKTSGAVALISFFLFMTFYTLVEVCGYAEALQVFK